MGVTPKKKEAPSEPFKRALGLFDAVMIVIGGIIGAGIFINPYIVAQRLESPSLVIGAWLAGAAIALMGALAYAELGAMFPAAGGQYVYLRDAYHPVVAFLYGWALLLMILVQLYLCPVLLRVGVLKPGFDRSR